MNGQIHGEYFGKGSPLFKLYFLTSILTVLTLGIYRFWAKTRIRKYIWSSVSGDGDSFEYTGTGVEKFLGFLVAMVILSIYLGIIQMALFFFGLNLFTTPETDTQALAQILAIYITLLAVLPLILFAQYRARRYRMARSRWRGLRFGMENGAWGYAFRAMGYYLLNLITLGLLNPLVTFRLEKYMADRTWYGDGQFFQHGRWQSLYGGMKHVFMGLGFIVLGIVIMVIGGIDERAGTAIFGGILFFVGYFWFLIGLVYYRVFAFNYLTGEKVLDGEVTFYADLATSRIITVVVIGFIVVGVLMGVIFGIIGVIGATSLDSFATGGGLGGASIVSLLAVGVLYALAFLAAGGLSLVMITQPIIDHAVTNITVINSDHLDSIRQRAADKGADAEGFADALDVGGAL